MKEDANAAWFWFAKLRKGLWQEGNFREQEVETK